jgi:hypothetical protein
MIDKLIVLIHVLFISFLGSYIFFIENSKYDYIYLSVIYFIMFLWMCFKGECILSYLYKKINNNNYKLGTNLNDDDFYYVFGEYRNNIIIIYNILLVLNIYIVCKRNNIKNYIMYIFIMFYVYYILFYSSYRVNKKIKLINYIVNTFLIIFGLYIITFTHDIYNINE